MVVESFYLIKKMICSVGITRTINNNSKLRKVTKMYHKNFLKLFLIAIQVVFLITACKNQDENIAVGDSDVVIISNANILTMNPEQPNAEAMAFKDGKIIAVGDLESVKKIAGSQYEYYDLEGQTVVPGFIESHEHMVNHGGALSYLDITPFTCPTLKEALAKVKNATPLEDGWIVAWAIDQTLYKEQRGPTLKELDALFPDTPVFLWHMSGHGAFVNSKALEIAGITKDTPNPKGGEYEKNENGEFTGYLKGQPAALSVYKIPLVNKETTLHSANMRVEQGFTTVTELAIMNSTLLKLIEDVTSEPDFPVRIYGGLFITMPGLDEVAKQVHNYETDKFKVKYIKTWTDGSLQGGSAYLREPYYKLNADTKKGARGTQEDFNNQVTLILNLGFIPAIHANADAAMDLAINAIEFARVESGNTTTRPHLIHCQLVREEQFQKIKEIGNVGMTFFTPHVYYWGDMHRDVILGPERAPNISAMKRAFELGIPTAMHNDAPVSPPNALHAMWVAVNRLTSSGKELGPDLKITPEQALISYTREAAIVLSIEDEVGTLQVGKYADFVILDNDPLKIDPMKIKDINVMTTVMGGNITFMRQEIYSTELH